MKTEKQRIFNGRRMEELRAGRNQREMARLLGVSGASWSAFENGTREPDLSTFMKICKILDVGFSELLNIQVRDPPQKIALTSDDVSSLIRSHEIAMRKLDELCKEQHSPKVAPAAATAGGGRVMKTA